MSWEQPESVDATFYAQVAPRWRSYGKDPSGHPILDGARVVALTQTAPARPKPGTVLCKLTLRIPAGAFLPLAPQAIVVIPADMTVTTPVEVIAQDAREVEA